VQRRFSALTAQGSEPIPNLSRKVLDITIEKHWDMLNDGLAEATKNGLAAFEGAIMRELLRHRQITQLTSGQPCALLSGGSAGRYLPSSVSAD